MNGAQYSIVSVDGEGIHIAERASLPIAKVTESADAMARWLRESVGFVLQHDDFLLGYRVVGRRKSSLWLLLLKVADGLQRVHVEHVTCVQCDARVVSANPTIADLYAGLPNKQEALERAWRRPVVRCPRCGGALPRPAIWAAIDDRLNDCGCGEAQG